MDESEESPAPSILPWLSLALSLAAAVFLTLPMAAPQGSGGLWLGLCAIYVVAEVVSPGMNGFGRFPLSAPAFLVLTAAPGSGHGGWLVLLLAGTLVRLVRATQRGEPVLNGAADTLPELWAAAAVALGRDRIDPIWGPCLGGLAYVLSWQLQAWIFGASLPTRLAEGWALARQRSAAVLGFLVLLGVCVSASLQDQTLSMMCLLLGGLLLGIPVQSQMNVLLSSQLDEERASQSQLREREVLALAERVEQVEQLRLDTQLQLRCLSVVGELFNESSRVQNPAQLRSSLLNSVRNLIPCNWVGIYKVEPQSCRLSASLGPAELQPTATTVVALAPDKVRPTITQVGPTTQMGLQFSDQGLIVLRREQPVFSAEQAGDLQRLAVHLPLCLDAIRYHENQSRALGDEQARGSELNRLAARLTSTLDLLARLVGCRTIKELVDTAQLSLPELLPHYQVEVQWRGMTYKPEGLSLARLSSDEGWPLNTGRGEVGKLRLFSTVGRPLAGLDRELLRLFSGQFACLLETAELYDDLRHTLDQLRHSQAQLVQSSKLAAIGQLAAGVAHELNTPLGAMTMGAELAKKFLLENPAKALERLEKVLTGAAQMQEVISKLMLYGRDTQTEGQSLDLYQVVQDTLQLLSLTDVQVELKAGPGLLVWGNPNQLHQAVRSLLINAKESQTKRIQMWLEDNGKQVSLHVKDFGVGMSEATGSRVFEPFFTTKPIGEGTGLGLPTALQLVQQHGGTLTFVSELGKGTTFTLTLPLFKSAASK